MAKSNARCVAAILVGLAVGVGGCSESPGEMVLVVQTDMSLPKDVDTIRIQVYDGSARIKHESTHADLGSATGLLLPATLGIVASEDNPDDPVTIRVSAGTNGAWRLVTEAVTVIPPKRVTTLHLPVQFLCDGSAEGDLADVINGAKPQCPDGQTCVAGRCQSPEVDGSGLPEYEEGDVFGGGSERGDGACLDVTECFKGTATVATPRLDGGRCTVAAPPGGGEINVALLTERTGLCADRRCFVALDAESSSGWTADADAIVLPEAACTPPSFASVATVGVAIAPVGDGCPRKTTAVPTCGPWSRIKKETDTPAASEPQIVAVGQHHPVSLDLDPTGNVVVWANTGLYEASADGTTKRITNGSVKASATQGNGRILVLEDADASPHQVVATASGFYWTLVDADNLGAVRFSSGPGEPMEIAPDLQSPEGLAVVDPEANQLLWTEFGAGSVTLWQNGAPEVIGAQNVNPYRVAWNGDDICWINEGILGSRDGVVKCTKRSDLAAVHEVARDQGTPRAIAVSDGRVYWANFDTGEIQMTDTAGNGVGVTSLVSGQGNPNGLALSGASVYWTNYLDGTVRRASLQDRSVESVAKGQDRPGAIKASAEYVYWVNEGSPYEPTGSVLRLPLSEP